MTLCAVLSDVIVIRIIGAERLAHDVSEAVSKRRGRTLSLSIGEGQSVVAGFVRNFEVVVVPLRVRVVGQIYLQGESVDATVGQSVNVVQA